MKKYSCLFLFVIVFVSLKAQPVNKANLTGTWQSFNVNVMNKYGYNSETKEFFIGNHFKKLIESDKTGSAQKSIDAAKKAIPEIVDGSFFTFQENEKYIYMYTGIRKEGTYTILRLPDVPGPGSDENNFLAYIDCYGYDGRISISDNKSGETSTIKVALKNGTLQLITSRPGPDIDGINFITTQFKKVSESKAALLKIQGEKDKELADKKKSDEVVAAKLKVEKDIAERNQKDEDAGGKIYRTAQKEPSFPGGDAAFGKHIIKALRFEGDPGSNGAPNGKYVINVTFTVNTDGSVSNIVAENNPGYGMAKLAVIIIEKSSWIPAENNGNKVRFRHNKNISFLVDIN